MGEVCKFFQLNTCRFGSRCRNIHVYEEQDDGNDTRRKPSGVSVLQRNKYVVNQAPREDPDLNKHLQEVSKDISAAETIWPATCYSYLPPFGNVQGFEDVSPEELRYKAYEAECNNNPQRYIVEINNLKANVGELRKSFLQKAPAAREILSDYIKNGPSRAKEFSQTRASGFNSSRFKSEPQNNPTTSGLFASVPQNNTPFAPVPQNNTPSMGFSSLPQNTGSFSLGNHPAFRGQPQSSGFNSNIFAQALNEGNQPSQSFPTNNPPSQFRSSIFGQPSFAPKTSVFGEVIQDNNAIRQNIFGNVAQSKHANESSLTAAQASQSSSQFGSLMSNSDSLSVKPTGNSTIYSSEADLTVEELEQFKATTFTYGKTPLKCPPRELC